MHRERERELKLVGFLCLCCSGVVAVIKRCPQRCWQNNVVVFAANSNFSPPISTILFSFIEVRSLMLEVSSVIFSSSFSFNSSFLVWKSAFSYVLRWREREVGGKQSCIERLSDGAYKRREREVVIRVLQWYSKEDKIGKWVANHDRLILTQLILRIENTKTRQDRIKNRINISNPIGASN
jgi:hypothetical protein